MRKLSSEVLDFYDDTMGEVFKARFPVPDLVPPFIKEAKLLSAEDRDALPDDLFALILNEEDGKFKKYAMNDKANTALSVIYFLDTGSYKMPPDIAKTAACRLAEGCLWYNIEPPAPLKKIADSRVLYGEWVEPNVDTEKVASVSHAPEVKILALPSQDKYPLDSYRDTLLAAEYFDKHAQRFHPRDRREYARNLEKRASALSIPISKSAQLYASEEYADRGHVAQQVYTRIEKTSGIHKQKYEKFFDKIASVTPGAAAEALTILDEESGLDSHWDGSLLDPYASVLNEEKRAESYAFHDMNGSVTDEDLHDLANTQQLIIEKALGKDFYKTYKDDPINVFKSLPLPEKRVLIRIMTSKHVSMD